jgi:hypothetical protein
MRLKMLSVKPGVTGCLSWMHAPWRLIMTVRVFSENFWPLALNPSTRTGMLSRRRSVRRRLDWSMKDPFKTLMLDNRSSLFIRTLSDKGFKAVSPTHPRHRAVDAKRGIRISSSPPAGGVCMITSSSMNNCGLGERGKASLIVAVGKDDGRPAIVWALNHRHL